MQDDWIFQELREAIRKRSEKPADEWFQDLIRRGVIDEKGNVLLRIPQPPTADAAPTPPTPAVNGDVAASEKSPPTATLPSSACDPPSDSAQ